MREIPEDTRIPKARGGGLSYVLERLSEKDSSGNQHPPALENLRHLN